MQDSELFEISLIRVIPAEKWRIIRLLTKVWEFPSYIGSVKEVSVIQKKHNTMQTKWRIQVDHVPISWIEEDTLDLKENAIRFKAIEGDLPEFQGKWAFYSHPDGTEVRVNVFFKVGIPAINDFADKYIKKLVTLNFEAILEAIERRLISTKYSSYKHGNKNKIAGFGIIAHLYNYCHLEKCLATLKPGIKMPSRAFLQQLYQITPSFKLCDVDKFTSKTGDSVNGCVVLATFIPDMMEQDQWAVLSKITKACKIAEKNGIGIVTLSSFASMVSQRIDHKISEDVQVPVTTGNSFTVAMVIDSILKACRELRIDLARSKCAIIGGTGEIGSACARIMANKVNLLSLSARNTTKLKTINDELSRKHKTKITIGTDNESAIKGADIVITAANPSASIINIEWFKPGSAVCDVGYPKNIPYYSSREDILVFSGGLVKSPCPINFPIDMGLPAADILYASYAEGIILALEKRYENFTPEKGNIIPDRVEEIRKLGIKHGFEVADFYWEWKIIPKEKIEKIRKMRQLIR
ncbi:MAG: SRPBCC family protein [Candidatus Omnitrophota bacterium]|nr:NAD(P)-binding domain-containing protein [Candidatus Omnitrophota bacterium]MBU2034526.1 NAD(P)-binding domain-containing protein [Candidatus Omnitrophota bacterium]MBU2221810.1 NAD(P)-binding domain-containing protein [Candidatus Omnitrophota bacterium]